LKSWRDPHLASTDIVGSGVHKQCPICRTSSKFVTPSSIFYKSGDTRKDTVIERYKESMKRIKCKYFETSPPSRRYCPFGKDCFYKHLDADGQEHVFEHEIINRGYARASGAIALIAATLFISPSPKKRMAASKA